MTGDIIAVVGSRFNNEITNSYQVILFNTDTQRTCALTNAFHFQLIGRTANIQIVLINALMRTHNRNKFDTHI